MSNLLILYLIIITPIIVIFIIAHYTNKLLWVKTIIYFAFALILIVSFYYQYLGIKNSYIYPIRDLISNVFLPVIALDEALISLDMRKAKKNSKSGAKVFQPRFSS
ncbi:hypothetical protein [Caldanaerobacter subterraneus]|uniref:Uncharacterized protein n=1 Tax=Caldanaerobacter subterraneus TaxID=911092 RepID=A0A7Y2PLS5_9THEO|nr:hypothetical protein [Caldanaerobacter subterraneus]NNG66398.1 hypothetical protein [Caldanaerobacter subterraneus]